MPDFGSAGSARVRASLAGLLAVAAAFAAEAAAPLDGELIAEAVKRIADGHHPRVYVDAAGKPMAGRVVDADAETIRVSLRGVEFPFRWQKLSPSRRYGIFRKVLPDDASTHFRLARWACEAEMLDEADAELTKARELDKGLAEEVRELRDKIMAFRRSKATVSRGGSTGARRGSSTAVKPKSVTLARKGIRVRKPILETDKPDLSKLGPHPRIWITPKKTHERVPSVEELRARGGAPRGGPAGAALAYLLRGDAGALAESKAYLRRRRGGNNPYVVLEQAIVYDWVCNGLTPEERKTFAATLVDSANASGTGHFRSYVGSLDNNTHRWVLPFGMAAIATAGEDDRAQGLLDKAWATVHGFYDYTGDHLEKLSNEKGYALYGGGWPEGQDYDRHGSRFVLPLVHALRSAGAVDGVTGSRYIHDKIYYMLYSMLPNRRHHVGLEDDDHQGVTWHDTQIMSMCAAEFPEAHGGTFRKLFRDSYGDFTKVMLFVFGTDRVKARPLAELPTARHVEGIGLVTMRSDWTENATFVSFQAGDHFVYHENNAENAFTIYRRAPLAVDAGVYDGRVHDHYVNYSIRSIAHNTVLVNDPGENFKAARRAANDGGQTVLNWNGWCFVPNRQQWLAKKPFAQKADILGFETNRVYDYAAGEAGRSYRKGKVPFFSRQVVLVKPDWVVVFDRVTSGNPSHQKTWICHAQDDVQDLGEGRFVATTSTGPKIIGGPMKMYLHSLMPTPKQGAKYEVVGGAGREYFYAGRNWRGRDRYGEQPGGIHRIEVKALPTQTTYFLHAFFVPVNPATPSPPAEIEEETAARVVVSLAGGKWRLAFSKRGPVKFEMLGK